MAQDADLRRLEPYAVCDYIGIAADYVGTGLQQILKTFNAVVMNRREKGGCGVVSGSAGDGSVVYRYFPAGHDCDAKAESRTIAGAIEHHLKSLDDGKLCRTECMDLTDMYCGPKLPFNSCRFFNKKTEL
ncbi:hypothetical protein HYQ45_008666 [Verticillium longisporum]|uniref:Secreted protein CSS2 C-terminal domain-containing protein n=1 Tax=Verticillium longisporum TaxID=100787 RepID=A0A8I3AR19_VERLO|nr:hypothetical protein HYQ45_008666 [Verticillium longisporum]